MTDKPMPKHAHLHSMTMDDDCLSLRVYFSEKMVNKIMAYPITDQEKLMLIDLLNEVHMHATTGSDMRTNVAQNIFSRYGHFLKDKYGITD